MSDNIREMIEDIANLVSIQMIRPLENRITVLETKLLAKQSRNVLFWKIVSLCFAIPSFVLAIIELLS